MRRAVTALVLLASACGTRPAPGATGGGSGGECPPNAMARTVCVECGPTDACVRREEICAIVCSSGSTCNSDEQCINGACQPFPCG
ncbi:MAG: hypothetical protein JNK82_35400 [Myxococcaceae bacterium]|nr:hypothetical protein [Myxococcaceae bacterium]